MDRIELIVEVPMRVLAAGGASWLRQLRQFIMSGWGLGAFAFTAALIVVLNADIAGLFVFAAVISAIFVLCDNVLATAAPALFTCLFMIKSGGGGAYDRLLPFALLAVIPVGALVFHLVCYRIPLVIGKAFWATLAVAIALLLGGIGFINAREYFALTSIYHMLALGFGVLITYFWLSCAIRENDEDLPEFVANLMTALGLLACFMVLHVYVVNLPYLVGRPAILAFQWRNNVSTFLMLALPFPFYKALRSPAWLLCGLLMYLGMLLSGSRGGMVFGSVELVMCILYVLLADRNRKRRWFYLAVIAAVVIAVVVSLPKLLPFFWPVLKRLLESVFSSDDEIRMGLYRRAIEDFLANPMFGAGLGYMGNRDIHASKAFALCWYHCAPLQIIGSLGIVGALAYGYQYVVRFMIFLRRRTKFHVALLLAWLGLEMMSLVNPGVFAPLPYALLAVMFVVFAEKAGTKAR